MPVLAISPTVSSFIPPAASRRDPGPGVNWCSRLRWLPSCHIIPADLGGRASSYRSVYPILAGLSAKPELKKDEPMRNHRVLMIVSVCLLLNTFAYSSDEAPSTPFPERRPDLLRLRRLLHDHEPCRKLDLWLHQPSRQPLLRVHDQRYDHVVQRNRLVWPASCLFRRPRISLGCR